MSDILHTVKIKCLGRHFLRVTWDVTSWAWRPQYVCWIKHVSTFRLCIYIFSLHLWLPVRELEQTFLLCLTLQGSIIISGSSGFFFLKSFLRLSTHALILKSLILLEWVKWPCRVGFPSHPVFPVSHSTF